MPSLKVLDLSDTPSLRLVLSNAITSMPNLAHVNLSRCSNLVYIASTAITNCDQLQVVDVSSTAVAYVDALLVRRVAQRVIVADCAALDCGCMAQIGDTFADRVDGLSAVCASSKRGACHDRLIHYPRGRVDVSVGTTLNLYCVSMLNMSRPVWTGAVDASTKASALSTLTSEYLRFDFVTNSDIGVYTCTLSDGARALVDVVVHQPVIALVVEEVGLSVIRSMHDLRRAATTSRWRGTTVCRRSRHTYTATSSTGRCAPMIRWAWRA